MERAREKIVAAVTQMTGRNDEPELYAGPRGDPGLCGPGSLSWEIHGDVSATAIAGTAAITMELLHPSVMAGVSDLSSYRTNPLKRSRSTAGYVIATTFAGTEAAERVIARVRRMHEKVNGTRPDGTPYRATDPTLLGWVHTSIPWFVMKAFERYNRPLSPEERNRYLAEQAVIGRKGGGGDIPTTTSELAEYVESMRPQLAVTEQTREFFDFLLDSTEGPGLPGALRRPSDQFQVHASMSLLPRWARELTGFAHSGLVHQIAFEPYLRQTARTLRWAFGVPAYRAMAEARMAGSASTAGRATVGAAA